MPTDADPSHVVDRPRRPGGPAGPDQPLAAGGGPARDRWPGQEEPSGLSVRERLAGWVRPTPGELVGLSLLVCGSVVATLLWWGQSVTGPATLEEVLAGGAAVAADGGTDGPAPGIDGPAPGIDAARPAGQPTGDGVVRGDGAASGEVTVYVSGAIGRPGLVTLPTGGRVGDAVLAAGGLTGEADPDRVNLARALVDGEHVHLPRVGEAAVGGVGPGGPAAADPGGAPDTVSADGLIDLNRASTAELEQLSGIGPARAAAIVAFRERSGPFAVSGDLRGVSGIGEAIFQHLDPLVVVRRTSVADVGTGRRGS